MFATGVEFLQALGFVSLLGLENSRFWRTILGSTFDPADILCYAAGSAMLMGFEGIFRRLSSPDSALKAAVDFLNYVPPGRLSLGTDFQAAALYRDSGSFCLSQGIVWVRKDSKKPSPEIR